MNVLLCPFSDPGYLYPALAVGVELRRRGHTVAVLGRPGAARAAQEAGLTALDAAAYGGTGAFSVGRWMMTGHEQYRAVVAAARDTGADALVASVLSHGALLAGEALDLPVTVLGFAAHLWPYRAGGDGEPEHLAQREWRLGELLRHYRALRERTGLPRRHDRPADRPLIGAGLLLRGDPALEYPGAVLPHGVRHVGPCHWEPRPAPAETCRVAGLLARSGKPVVYVHLGREFGGTSLWPRLNAAFTGGPYQAVVELGRSGGPRAAPRADIVTVRVPYMGPLIELSEMVLTSGTSSPVLAALRHGRPLAVAPAGSEQPLLADACERAGVAVRFPGEGTAAALTGALDRALTRETVRRRARWLGARLRDAGGAAAAAGHVVSTVSSAPATPTGARP
ncbi:hypothetical protein ABGB17_30250 [Sphaerisporangium sp. B11E5]|uniref:glycosyltransferase n=1 Tax=Sphaerisporangium sp. B11E5 TaxID=3153563 RepID=UPI00325D1E53